MPLLLAGSIRYQFANVVEKAESFEDLPVWAKQIIEFGESHVNSDQCSIYFPIELLPKEIQEWQSLKIEPSPFRYWKKCWQMDRIHCLVFRKNDDTWAVEMYTLNGWVNAFDRWESIVMEPDYEEIDEREAKILVARYH